MENKEGVRIAKALAKAHQRAGEPSWARLAKLAVLELGITAPSDQTIANYHAPETFPRKYDIDLVAFLCRQYRTTLNEVSPELAEEAERRADLLMQSRRPARTINWMVGGRGVDAA